MYGVSNLRHIQELEGGGVDSEKRDSSDVVIEAVASGASLASTSIAIAVTMMKQQGILDTAIGTPITTAAMLDDVVSLILLGIVSSIGGSGSGIRPMTVVQPLLASFGIILVGVSGCAVVSRVKSRKTSSMDGDTEMEGAQGVAERVSDTGIYPEKTLTSRHCNDVRTRILVFYTRFASTIRLAGMLIAGLAYSILAEYLGSSRLLGAFVAGVFFSALENLCQMYEGQITDKIQPAMSAIFFATIGFAIPLTKILESVLFGWGVVYAVIASLSKLVTMVVVPARISSEDEKEESGNRGGRYSARWMVGAAMIARGELGLLMVQQAQAQGVMSQTTMVITTWSIVLATLFGVGAFNFVMKQNS